MQVKADVVFKSKVDRWLVVVIAVSFMMGPLLIALHFSERGLQANLVALSIAAAASLPPALIIVWLFRNTDYTLTATELVVRAGPTNWSVPLASIRSVRPTRSILSAPALSLDRIEIVYGTYGTVVISPEDKRAFALALRERVPAVDISAIEYASGS